jgi:nucleotide-binding universal stress UspA family protein
MSEQSKQILLTTDFSEESYEAFAPVVELARSMNAKITLLYVLPSMDTHATGVPFMSPVPMPSDEDQLKRSLEDLEKLRPQFGEGVEVVMDARAGEEIPEVILEYAEEKNIDIIALSTHARRGLSRLVMGSITEEVLRHSKVPVYVVPQHHQ